MALRFRRRIRLFPGVNLNVGKTGVSLSAGIRGASITAGRRGVYSNVGAPGTGLSFRSKLDRKRSAAQSTPAFSESGQPTSFNVVLRLRDDGQVLIEGHEGQALTQSQLKLLRERHGDLIHQWLDEGVAKLNSDYEACVNLHLATPSPTNPSWLVMPTFEEPAPIEPMSQAVRFIDRLLLRRRRIESANARRAEDYRRDLEDWNARGKEHLRRIDELQALAQGVVNGDRTSMETILNNTLSALPWPRETDVSYDFGDDCTTLGLDVDLPEIEDMPNRIASVAARGLRVNFKNRSEAQVRRDYTRLVHGTAYRIAGEVFANLPTVSQITLSGFTQRPDSQTGDEKEEYVISVRIGRSEWETINFEKLPDVDPINALARFEIVVSPDRTGRLREIEPLR